MSKKEQDDVTLDADQETTASVEESSEDTSSASTKEETTGETTDDNNTEETEGTHNRTLLIVEVIAAIAVIGFIIYAIVTNGNSSVSDNSASANTSINAAGSVSAGEVVIDNSILYTDIPAIPEVSTVNNLTLEECEARVADGTMIVLTTEDGIDVYINNYLDSEYFNANATYTQEDVDTAIMNEVLAGYAESVSTNRTVAQINDLVDIDFVGTKDGVAFEGGTAEAQQLMLGSNSYIPGFEEGIIGMEVGETKDVTLNFPEDYSTAADLAGQEVVFSITLNSIISETTYPELTDAMVAETFTDITTVSECQAEYATAMLKNSIWTFIGTDFYVSDIPDDTVLAYYNSTMDYYDLISKNYQMNIADLMSMYGSDVSALKADVMDTSASSAKYSILYAAIGGTNALTVTDEDIATLAADYGYTDTEVFLKDYGAVTIYDYILQSKVMDYLVEIHE